MRNSIDRKMDDKENSEPEKEILTLFGMNGPVGTLFCKFALSAGYHIQALSPTLDLDFQHECLTVKRGDIGTVGEDVLQELLQGATYCVCLPEPKGKEYPPGRCFDFHKRLHPLLKECPTLQLLLYQASSTSIGATGSAPVLANVVKFVKSYKDAFLADQDKVVKHITEDADDVEFCYIVTRPGITRNGGRSKKRLAASKSQPLVPVTTADLADFTLSALRMEKLYNTCPYVVGDGS